MHGRGYRLLIRDAAGGDGDLKVKALAYKLGEHLGLHSAHYAHAYLAQTLVPLYVKLGILILELPELLIGGKRVRALGKLYAIAHNSLGLRPYAVAFKAEPLAGIGIVKPLHGDDAAGARLLYRLIARSGVYSQLGDRLSAHAVAIAQRTSGYLHAAQAPSAHIAHYLIHPCAELGRINGTHGEFFDKFDKLRHTIKPEPRAVEHGKEFSLCDKARYILIGYISAGREFLQNRLIAHGDALVRLLRRIGKVKAVFRQTCPQIVEYLLSVACRKIHFRHENDRRHPVPLEQMPQRFGVRLNTVGAGYDEQRIIESVEHALGLRGEVGMSGRVKKAQLHIIGTELRLF